MSKHDKKNNKEKQKKIKKIHAAGGVIFYRNEDKNTIKFLLLKHRGGKKHWALPKGHVEKNESYLECAIREIKEETGLKRKDLTYICELDHKTKYEKFIGRLKRRKALKIVHLFLFQAKNNKINLSKEHTKYKWVKFTDIPEQLTFTTSIPAFEEANKIILQEYSNST